MSNNGRNNNYEGRKVTSWFPAPVEAPTLRISYLTSLPYVPISPSQSRRFWSIMFTILFLRPGVKRYSKNKTKQTKHPHNLNMFLKKKIHCLKDTLSYIHKNDYF